MKNIIIAILITLLFITCNKNIKNPESSMTSGKNELIFVKNKIIKINLNNEIKYVKMSGFLYGSDKWDEQYYTNQEDMNAPYCPYRIKTFDFETNLIQIYGYSDIVDEERRGNLDLIGEVHDFTVYDIDSDNKMT